MSQIKAINPDFKTNSTHEKRGHSLEKRSKLSLQLFIKGPRDEELLNNFQDGLHCDRPTWADYASAWGCLFGGEGIAAGMSYLERLGDTGLGCDAHSCCRISCSWQDAIYWCNDVRIISILYTRIYTDVAPEPLLTGVHFTSAMVGTSKLPGGLPPLHRHP